MPRLRSPRRLRAGRDAEALLVSTAARKRLLVNALDELG